MSGKPVRERGKPREDTEAAAYRLEDQAGYLLRRAHQRSSGHFMAVMGGFDVTPTQFAALAKLDDAGPVSQNELGRLTAMDPATIWGVASRLVKRGLVRQSVSPDDARLVMVDLTPQGREAVRAMKDAAAEVSARTLEPLSPDEGALFLSLLRRLG
jgi:DNA-binding MarR family transcriptional regulator